MHTKMRMIPLLAVAVAALALSACGSSKKSSSSSSSSASGTKSGGVVTVLDVAGGIDGLDPGYWYYQDDYADIQQPTQRMLYFWPPSNTSPVPDLATALPTLSDGGKTLTIHIRAGVRYSPPLQSRSVTAADIKYGMDRCFDAGVGNGYEGAYYSHIIGAPAKLANSVPNVPGIEAPNATTLVLKLTQPVGVLATGQALALPCTVPVPQSYAAKYDTGATPSYGQHQVFTGPYMVKGAGSGTLPPQGYTANKILDLVRNPSWNRATDTRPAHFNEIVVKEGYTPEDASQSILNGQSMLSGDFAAPPPDIAQRYLTSKASQFQVIPSQGIRYISLNTKIKPLDNVNVRRAIIAVTDRTALVLTRGGKYIGIPATHMLPPGILGFEQAGGNAGPGNDFYANPQGNLALAESYMKKAGYPSGKYTGGPLLAVGDSASPAKETAETFVQQVKQLGFNVQLTEVPHKTMLTKYCEVPKNQPAFCTNQGWEKDFFDAQSMVDPLLNGANIGATGNVNSPQVNDPVLNGMLASASKLTNAAARATAYANVDKYATSQALYDDWIWDNEVNLESSNLNAVSNKFSSSWDYVYSAFK